jgi:hypothetical protein
VLRLDLLTLSIQSLNLGTQTFPIRQEIGTSFSGEYEQPKRKEVEKLTFGIPANKWPCCQLKNLKDLPILRTSNQFCSLSLSIMRRNPRSQSFIRTLKKERKKKIMQDKIQTKKAP